MIDLGNDIVDLLYKENQNKTDKFIQRVFTVLERQAIYSSRYPHIMLWAVWSAKEAAFKSYKKYDTDISFVQRKFVIPDDALKQLEHAIGQGFNIIYGVLFHQELSFNLRWQIDAKKIHCISILQSQTLPLVDWNAVNISMQKTNYASMQMSLTQLRHHFTDRELACSSSLESLYIRFYAKQYLWSLGFDKKIEIIRMPLAHQNHLGPPLLYLGNDVLPNQISLSHDGNWIAFALLNGS